VLQGIEADPPQPPCRLIAKETRDEAMGRLMKRAIPRNGEAFDGHYDWYKPRECHFVPPKIRRGGGCFGTPRACSISFQLEKLQCAFPFVRGLSR
jgi:hypothetical protein